MTVCAEVRTIPQHIEQTFDLFAPDFLHPIAAPTP
jgi:ATP adenylyltransferase